MLLSSIHFKIPLSIPCFTWIPEKEVSKLASVNDNAPLYLVGINPSYDIKSSNKKWDQVDKLQLEFAKFYKETFVEKHDYKKIKNDLKTFQTLACIKQQRSNGAITTLSAVTYQMGNDKEAFIYWIAVSNKNYNGNIRSCRRLGFGELMLTTLLKACSINEMKKDSTLYLQLDESNKTAFNFYTKLGFVHAIDSNDMQNQIKYIEENLTFDFNEGYYVYPLDNNNNVTHKLYLCTSARFGPNKTKEIFNEPKTIDKQEEIKQEETKQKLVEIDSDKMQEENKQILVKNNSE